MGAIIGYQEGSGFSARYRYAVRTKRGWMGLDLQKFRGNLGGKNTSPVQPEIIEQAESVDVLAKGIKPGGRIQHTAQLEGLGAGSLVQAHDGKVFERQSNGKWSQAVPKPEPGTPEVESHHFDGAINLGLKLKKVT